MVAGKKKSSPKKATPRRATAGRAPVATPQPPSPSAADEGVRSNESTGIPVVGLCASAGGLNAFKKFLTNLPAQTDMAYILVPHLDPNHPSLLVDLLSKSTSVPISEASEGMAVAADHIYVLPQDKYLTISEGKLHLTGPVQRNLAQTSIDLFLRSLADDQHERAVCIILSGTGGHGTPGLQAIKANGGLAMVQDPATAEFDGMPKSAIATGLVDYVLAPEEMPGTLVAYMQHFRGGDPSSDDFNKESPQDLNRILALLRAKTKYDFRCYRNQMLIRRIERRMGVCHIDQMANYLALLRDNPDELKRLSRDLLISVTSFFRDPEAFHVIETQVIPQVLQSRDGDSVVRVWVPGCATGEEAYSLAILFLEQIAASEKNCRLQIFATDVDEDALEVARKGIFPEIISANVSEERLRRFFTRTETGFFRVNKQLREVVTFASQNLISDTPFSKMDLVSCRNLLIYLEPAVQRKVILLLHFALNPGAYLFLGSAETIGPQVDLFEPVSNKWRVYRRLMPARIDRVEFPIASSGDLRGAKAVPADATPGQLRGFAELTASLLLERYAPAAVLINRRHEVLYFFGPTASFLHQPTGTPTQDLMLLARDGLRTTLRAAIHKALTEPLPVVESEARIKRDGGFHRVHVSVKTVHAPSVADGLLLVTFQYVPDATPARTTETDTIEESSSADQFILEQLESELASTREDLQTTIVQFETSNAQLKASNEEVVSMNEELQSANEELETSKEELQSLNEELSTINSQLQGKLEELEQANNDLANLLSSTDVATIFLNLKLTIKQFTPSTSRLLNLLPSDVGRPLSDIAPKFTDESLIADCEAVLRDLAPCEKEVHTRDGRWCLRRVVPYRTSNHRIDGVVITFADITAIKASAEQARRLATVLMDSNDAVCMQDFAGHMTAWNRSAELMYGYSEAEALNMNVADRIPETQRDAEIALFDKLRQGEVVPPREAQRLHRDGHVLDVWLTATILKDLAGQPCAIATTERDITRQKQLNAELERRVLERTRQLYDVNQVLQAEAAERQRVEKALRETSDHLSAIIDTAAEGIVTFTEQEIVESYNKAAEKMFGYSPREVIGQSVRRLLPEPFPEAQDGNIESGREMHVARVIGIGREVLGRRKEGTTFPMEVSLSELHDGSRLLFTALIRDVTAHKALEKEVVEIAAQEQLRIGQDLHDSVGQELTALGLTAQSLADALTTEHQVHKELAIKLANGIRQTLKQVRMLSRGLIPVEGESAGLMTALEDLTAQVREKSGIICRFECPTPVRVQDNVVATQLFRIAQEAITNAVKHAQPQHIDVRLQLDHDHIILIVEDDGTGIQNTPQASHGIGLRTIRYRAGLINALVTITTSAGKGTVVTCRLPEGVKK